MRGPFAGKRFDGAVPDQALRVRLAHRQELALKICFSDLEGGGQVNVIRGDFKLHKPLSTNHPPPHHRHSRPDKSAEGVHHQIRDLEEADAKEQLEALDTQRKNKRRQRHPENLPPTPKSPQRRHNLRQKEPKGHKNSQIGEALDLAAVAGME